MEETKWYPVFYNGIETNIEVTECGRVRRVEVDWYGNGKGSYKIEHGEVDFNKLKLAKGYKIVATQVKNSKQKSLKVHQLIASVFYNYVWQGHKLVVDHIDSNPLNNNKDNLRVITNRENCSKEKTLKSGLPVGVYFNKQNKKYISMIYINKKREYLGSFNTPEEASKAYQKALVSIKELIKNQVVT
jgi:hypothetical protein